MWTDDRNVVAAIDRSNIPIKAPKENHEKYFNQKHFYSYLVQGILTPRDSFYLLPLGFPGVCMILECSPLWWETQRTH